MDILEKHHQKVEICTGNISYVNLKILPEPLKDKKILRKEIQLHREFEIVNLKHGTWIASSLWSKMDWRKELKKYGFTWQKFVRVVESHCSYSYDWVEGNAKWENVTRKFIERVEDEIKAAVEGLKNGD